MNLLLKNKFIIQLLKFIKNLPDRGFEIRVINFNGEIVESLNNFKFNLGKSLECNILRLD